ncbi:hypothetical protein T484DRAFT_1911594, partial [Baffinella frigidus]
MEEDPGQSETMSENGEHPEPLLQGMTIAGMAAEERAQGGAGNAVGTPETAGGGGGGDAQAVSEAGEDAGMTVAGMAAEQRAQGGAGIPGRLGESSVPGRTAGTRVKQMAVPRADNHAGASALPGASSGLAGAVAAPLGGGARAGGRRVDEAEMLFLMVRTLEESCPGAARALREEAEGKGLFGTTRDWT